MDIVPRCHIAWNSSADGCPAKDNTLEKWAHQCIDEAHHMGPDVCQCGAQTPLKLKVTQDTMLHMVLRELVAEDRQIESVDLEHGIKSWNDGNSVRREHIGRRTITIITVEK